MQTLTTDRLLIRKLTPDDRESAGELFTEKFDYFYGPVEEDDIEKRMNWTIALSNWDWASPFYGDRAVLLKETEEIIGLVGIDPWTWLPATKQKVPDLFPDPNDLNYATIEFELGYAMKESFRGNGYATEASIALIDFAFTEGKIKRILARTSLTKNPRSVKMIERLGMKMQANAAWGGEGGVVGLLTNPDLIN